MASCELLAESGETHVGTAALGCPLGAAQLPVIRLGQGKCQRPSYDLLLSHRFTSKSHGGASPRRTPEGGCPHVSRYTRLAVFLAGLKNGSVVTFTFVVTRIASIVPSIRSMCPC